MGHELMLGLDGHYSLGDRFWLVGGAGTVDLDGPVATFGAGMSFAPQPIRYKGTVFISLRGYSGYLRGRGAVGNAVLEVGYRL